nr:G protein-coupled receptor [Proales similis]
MSLIHTNSSDHLYQTAVLALTIPLFLITTLGNGVILLTIKMQARLLSTSSNYFILSLSLADFLVGCAVMPIMIMFTANRSSWPYNQMLCDSWMAVDFLCSSASFLTLSAMSIERYKMLTSSYVQIKHSSKMRTIVLVGLSWLLPFITWLPVVIGSRRIEGPNEPGVCDLLVDKYVVVALFALLYHVPFICMVAFYTKLIIHIKSSAVNQSAFDFEFSYVHAGNTARRAQVRGSGRFDSIDNPSRFSEPEKQALNERKTQMPQLKIRSKPNNPTDNSREQIRLALMSKSCVCCSRDPRADSTHTYRKENQLTSCSVSNLRTNKQRRKKAAGLYYCSPASDGCQRNMNKWRSENFSNDFSASISGMHSERSLAPSTIFFPKLNAELNDNGRNELSNGLMAKCFPCNLSRQSSFEVVESNHFENMRLKRNRKAARMLGLLVASISICWLPFCIFYPLGKFYPNLLPNSVQLIIWWLGYFNSTVNPFLYVYSNKNIRRSVRILLFHRLSSFLPKSRSRQEIRSNSLRFVATRAKPQNFI